MMRDAREVPRPAAARDGVCGARARRDKMRQLRDRHRRAGGSRGQDHGNVLSASWIGRQVRRQPTAATSRSRRIPSPPSFPAAPGTYRLRVAAVDATGKGARSIRGTQRRAHAGRAAQARLVAAHGPATKGASPRSVQGRREDRRRPRDVRPAHRRVTARWNWRRRTSARRSRRVQPGGPSDQRAGQVPYYGEIPIATLAPGDYVVRAIVQHGGQPEGRVIEDVQEDGKK